MLGYTPDNLQITFCFPLEELTDPNHLTSTSHLLPEPPDMTRPPAPAPHPPDHLASDNLSGPILGAKNTVLSSLKNALFTVKTQLFFLLWNISEVLPSHISDLQVLRPLKKVLSFISSQTFLGAHQEPPH